MAKNFGDTPLTDPNKPPKTPKGPAKPSPGALGKMAKRMAPPSGMSARDAAVLSPYGRNAMRKPRPSSK